jgi:hypothetical protein
MNKGDQCRPQQLRTLVDPTRIDDVKNASDSNVFRRSP